VDRVPANRIARKTGRRFTVDLTCLGLTRQVYADRNSLCYNSVTEHGQMFGVAVPGGGFGAVWLTVHLLSI